MLRRTSTVHNTRSEKYVSQNATFTSGHTCFLPRCLRRVRGSRICSATEASCQKSPVGMADWTAKNSAFESLQSGPPPYAEGPAMFATQKQSCGASLFTCAFRGVIYSRCRGLNVVVTTKRPSTAVGGSIVISLDLRCTFTRHFAECMPGYAASQGPVLVLCEVACRSGLLSPCRNFSWYVQWPPAD